MFGMRVVAVVRIGCALHPDFCYMADNAWLYIPLMASVPGLLVQGFVVAIKKIILRQSFVWEVLFHALAAFILVRLWLIVASQESGLSLPAFTDLPFLIGGAIMGAVICGLTRNCSNKRLKRDAQKARAS